MAFFVYIHLIVVLFNISRIIIYIESHRQSKMKKVKIIDGLFYGKVISGEFQFVAERPADHQSKREMYVNIIRFGKNISVHVNRADFVVIEDETMNISNEEKEIIEAQNIFELGAKIKKNFEMMNRLIEMVVRSDVNSLIISGAPGIGKSYGLETRMNKALLRGEIAKFTQVKGKMSALGLYATLYEHRDCGDVLLLDDVDVFGCETSLDLLKAVLDSGDVRTVNWSTASSWLEQQEIPRKFNFNGSIVFLTNIDFDKQIKRGSNLAPHLSAFLGRSTYLDLAIHSNKAILVRIKQVVEETNMLEKHGIDEEQKILMLEWLDLYYDQLRDLSIRTILKLASYMHGAPDAWIDIAETTMLKPNSI